METYPHKFHVSMSILEYVEKFGVLNNGDHLEDVLVNLAGIEIRGFLLVGLLSFTAMCIMVIPLLSILCKGAS